MGLKRLSPLFFVVLVLGAIVWSRQGKDRAKVLHVCTWSNYFSEDVLQAFTQKTGIKVRISYISSNEELFAKLRAGASGFDIIQPSDYMVKRMRTLAMLTPLDHKQLPHLDQLETFYRHPAYDPELEVAVPFTWGTTGIAVNTAKVAIPATGVDWNFLLNSPDPRHTSLLDDMREVFGAGLMAKGHSLNSRDPEQLKKVKEEIAAVKNRILMFTSEPKPLLLKEELFIAHVFSSDAVQAHAANPSIRYFIPKEGATLWTDNFAIPKSSQLSTEAHLFMDYFLDAEHALRIIRENHLGTVNRLVKAQVPKEELEDPNIYPPQEMLDKLHYLEDLGELTPVVDRMWTELKS